MSVLGKRNEESELGAPNLACRRGTSTVQVDHVVPSAADAIDKRGFPPLTDGTTDRPGRSTRRAPVSAIFIHAGAGYHSVANETIHLQACSE